MKKFVLIIALLFPILLSAQNISVSDFRLDPNDQTANAYGTQVTDQNGEVCALIRIQTTQKGFSFDVGSMGVTKAEENHIGEVWVYVPHGVRRITIRHQQLGTLSDYQFPVAIEKARTYVMNLTTGKVTTVVEDAVSQQFVVFDITPASAALTFDNAVINLTNGKASVFKSFGTYDYRVDCNLYHPQVGKLTVADPDNPVPLKVSLNPNFGYIDVEGSSAQGGIVYIDNERKGTVPFHSDPIKSGSHSVTVSKEMYNSFTQSVTVTDGQHTRLTPTLSANYAHLTFAVDNNAEIWIDGSKAGNGSVSGDYSAGPHRVEAKLPNHRPTSQTIEVSADMMNQRITLTAPTPITGTLLVNSTPIEAEIIIDGKDYGKTPKQIRNILIGTHQVKLSISGYADYSTNINIEEGKTAEVTATLQNTANVRINCTPSKAKLYLDGQYLGQGSGTYTMTLGSHSLRADADGYKEYRRNITINSANENYSVNMESESSKVRITCTPSNAKLFLDGQYLGQGSGTYTMTLGGHTLRAEADGFKQSSQNISVTNNGESYSVELEPIHKDKQTFTVNGVRFTMVAVEGGTFTMGATSEQVRTFTRGAISEPDSGPDSDEKPAHRVTLSNYYIGETEVTQALWMAVMGSNPSYRKGENLPVENFSWNDCQTFITKLNQLTGKKFRLPTEAEWEYAARGGKKSKGYKYSGSYEKDNVAWYDGNCNRQTHPVAQKQANELGLYDMSGNVWEWCQDWYGYYSNSPQTNPQGANSSSYRVYRGGGWISKGGGACRVSRRGYSSPAYRNFDLGLRLALSE